MTPRYDVGATAVEYSLIVALIAATIILAVQGLGTATQRSLDSPCAELSKIGRSC